MYNVPLCSLRLSTLSIPFALWLLLITACSETQSGPPSSPPLGPKPETVQVQAGQLTAGFAGGSLREAKTLSSFSIQKFPTTVAQYRACVQAGACQPPSKDQGLCALTDRLPGNTFYLEGTEALPVTCVPPSQAKAFCSWVGASLPSPEQWQLAARGPSVRKFPWGDEPRQCALQPKSSKFTYMCCDGPECTQAGFFAVGQRAQAASPSGMQDILTFRGEVVRGDKLAQFQVCSNEQGFCLLSGTEPLAIEHITPLDAQAQSDLFTFRCSWKEGS